MKRYFSDVDKDTPHASEIWWLGSSGISTGWAEADGTRTFRPYSTLARADMAAFMHRMVEEGVYEPAAEHEYRFDGDGHVVTGWSDGSIYDSSTGALVKAGWVKDGKTAYYIDPETGEALKGGIHEVAGYSYLFSSKGAVRHGWVEVDGTRRYFSKGSGMLYSLKSSGNEELDAVIGAMAEQFGCNGRSSLKKAYEWIATFTYSNMNTYPKGDWESWSMKYAIEMYNNQTGNCYRYASLTCWYARALGYDAVTISGESRTATGWQPHSWVEINKGGTAYVVDTQQHGRSWNKNRDFFFVDYDKAPLYYRLTDGTELN